MFHRRSLLISTVKTPKLAVNQEPALPETPRIDAEKIQILAKDFVTHSAKVVVLAAAAVVVMKAGAEIAVNNTNPSNH